MTRKADRLGRIVDYGYDADDRIETEKWLPVGGGAAVNTVTYTYDDADRATQVQDVVSNYAHGPTDRAYQRPIGHRSWGIAAFARVKQPRIRHRSPA